MVEKDEISGEKDELVVSKDRLWREMHQMLREKSERILFLHDQRMVTSNTVQKRLENQRLCAEFGDLRRRNREPE